MRLVTVISGLRLPSLRESDKDGDGGKRVSELSTKAMVTTYLYLPTAGSKRTES